MLESFVAAHPVNSFNAAINLSLRLHGRRKVAYMSRQEIIRCCFDAEGWFMAQVGEPLLISTIMNEELPIIPADPVLYRFLSSEIQGVLEG